MLLASISGIYLGMVTGLVFWFWEVFYLTFQKFQIVSSDLCVVVVIVV